MSNVWWTKEHMQHQPLNVASLINSQPHALWICNDLIETIMMSRLTNERVQLEFAAPGHISIPVNCRRVYLCDQKGIVLQDVLKSGQWSAKRDRTGNDLWELTRVPGTD
jgi:hypothetical protein